MSSYYFGSAEQTAQVYLDQMSSYGPEIEGGIDDIESMEPQEAKSTLAKFYGICRRALREGVTDDVWEILEAKYDKAFAYVVTVDDDLRNALALNKHQYVSGATYENMVKYKKLAGILV